MSKTKKTAPKGTKGGKGGGGTKVGGKDREALRGMIIGMIVFAALAGFFMLPIGGKTSFTHLLHALGMQGGETAAPAKTPGPEAPKSQSARPRGPGGTSTAKAATPAPAAPIREKIAQRPARPKAIRVAENAAERRPLEKASAEDDEALDRLVRRHAGR